MPSLFGIVLHKTAIGRRLFAIGSNPVAARFSGIPVDRLRLCLFVLSGILSGLAAALLTARLGSMRSNIAVGWELDIVTMVILGGVSIAGGVGSILGVVLAVLVLGLVTFGMSLNNIPGQVVSVYIGALLILVIAIPRLVDKWCGECGEAARCRNYACRTSPHGEIVCDRPDKGGDWLSCGLSHIAEEAGWRNSSGVQSRPLRGRCPQEGVRHERRMAVAMPRTSPSSTSARPTPRSRWSTW